MLKIFAGMLSNLADVHHDIFFRNGQGISLNAISFLQAENSVTISKFLILPSFDRNKVSCIHNSFPYTHEFNKTMGFQYCEIIDSWSNSNLSMIHVIVSVLS